MSTGRLSGRAKRKTLISKSRTDANSCFCPDFQREEGDAGSYTEIAEGSRAEWSETQKARGEMLLQKFAATRKTVQFGALRRNAPFHAGIPKKAEFTERNGWRLPKASRSFLASRRAR